MSTTVKTLLSLPIFKENVSIVNPGDLNRDVEKVTVMEAPDFHFDAISGNTLVLTTLSAHHESLEDINDTIENLCKANVSGILVKIGRFIDSVDPSTYAICKRYDIPLLTVNSNIYFTDILSSSYFYLANDYASITKEINDLNNSLMTAVGQNRTIRDLMKIIDRKFNGHSYLLDSHMNIVESTSNSPEEIGLVENVTGKLIKHRAESKKYLFQQRDNAIVHVCNNNASDEGYFCIVVKNVSDVPGAIYMQTISKIMSVKLLENEIIENAKQQMISSLADDILFTEHNDEQVVIDRLKMLHFSPKDKHILMMVNKGEKNIKNSHLYTVCENAIKSFFESCFIFLFDDSLIVLLSLSENRNDANIYERINDFARRVKEAIGEDVIFSASSFTTDLRNIPNCYNQAKKAMRFGNSCNNEKPVFFYDDFIDIGLISHGLDSKTSDIFFERIINPILEYDRQYNSKLWASLECCFQSQSLEEASENLFIHISTLRYRIQKIESLTGYSYMNNKNRMILYLAYLLYRAKC